ncbi:MULTISPECIES: hypothetical protein [unclassified Chryseobacterium]|uniref:hypothetical protein n=1 Tax=unclassified Chryseobacterium TaxID=2593645 RepID=UPI000D70C874|nr:MULTISPECIES: hypothetical protein [unclassified Chryseobacterium]PWW19392.1 hypothetical protein DEU40_11954 [Chryseobacterium sp. AG844]
MKKIILIAGILTAGIMSAATAPSKNEKSTTSKIQKENRIEVLKKDSKTKKKYSKFYPIYYTTSCGVAAVTNQSNWSEAQIMAWTEALEANYCN